MTLYCIGVRDNQPVSPLPSPRDVQDAHGIPARISLKGKYEISTRGSVFLEYAHSFLYFKPKISMFLALSEN